MSQDMIIGLLTGSSLVYLYYKLKASGILADAWKFMKNPEKY